MIDHVASRIGEGKRKKAVQNKIESVAEFGVRLKAAAVVTGKANLVVWVFLPDATPVLASLPQM